MRWWRLVFIAGASIAGFCAVVQVSWGGFTDGMLFAILAALMAFAASEVDRVG